MQLDVVQYNSADLRAHKILADVLLLDTWSFELKGGGPGRTIADFRCLWTEDLTDKAGFFVRSLFRIRKAVGNFFGWDERKDVDKGKSFIRLLPQELKELSLSKPGSDARIEPFWVLYETVNESLDEVINKTVHAFSCMQIEPTTDGYRVIWGIYVKPVGWFTDLYMAAIKPFRYLIVYPKIIRLLEAAWYEKYSA